MLTLRQTLEDQKDLQKLCSDNPPRPLITKEIFHPNAFYGNDIIYKEYAGLPNDYPLKIVIPHCPDMYGLTRIWTEELSNSLPVIAAYSDIRHKKYSEALQKTGIKKKIYYLASPYLYLLELIKKKGVIETQIKRKGTIFFPTHSTHHIKQNINNEILAEALLNLEDEYQPVTVCLYWADYDHKEFYPYLQKGLRVVSAGHMYDPKFLFRLYHLFSLHRYTTSNLVGSFIPFSIKSGCSYFHLDVGPSEIEFGIKKSDPAQYIEVSRPDEMLLPNDWYQLFKNRVPSPTPEQIAIVDRYLGSNYMKTPSELRQKFMEAEYLHRELSKDKRILLTPKRSIFIDHLMYQIVNKLNSNENKKVLELSEKALSIDYSLVGVIYGKAIALARLERYNEAVGCLNHLLSKCPNHKKATNLLDALKDYT